MRRGSNPDLIFHNEQLLGVTLSADYCAEHEWGIKPLRKMCAMDGSLPGLHKGFINNAESFFQVEYEFTVWSDETRRNKKRKFVGFLAIDGYGSERYKETPPHDLRPYEAKLCAAWCDHSLGVLAPKGSEEAKHLQTIFDACKAGDGMICFASQMKDNPFERAGLCVLIRSRLPEEWQQESVEAELEKERLRKAWEDAGGFEVMEQLKNAGKNWYSLGDSIKMLKRGETDTELVLCSWLNPTQQDIYDFGWMTVDDLRDWLKGTGRVMQKRKGA